jgi:hypothetical protein
MQKKKFLKAVSATLVCAVLLTSVLFTACDNGLVENPASRQIEQAKNVGVPTTHTIANAADMALIGAPGTGWLMSDDYILEDDITLSKWTPIGTEANPFNGTFTGTDTSGIHTITITDFSNPALVGEYLGIFGYVTSTGTNPDAGYIHDLNVVSRISQYAAKASSSQYVGALVGWADRGSVLQNIVVEGDLDYASENRIYLGGIAGYLNGASLTNSSSTPKTTVEVSVSSPLAVYAGGAVGYGINSASITGVRTTSSVSISNGAVNTSAGGVSGYTVNTTLTNCHAEGAIDVRLQRPAMIYVGGLAGYAEGGTITLSHAEGTVNAQSNYPYAGGLVGYNYMGNVISKSYAAGNVSANGNTDLDDSYPYAGGLVGYNSGGFTEAPSTVEDCYATGKVSAFGPGNTAWAGGIAGSNAREAVITRTYSRGEIEVRISKDPPVNSPAPGAIAGGIAGYHYFGTPNLANSFALNQKITATVPTATSAIIHRVVGKKDATSVIGTNRANAAMVLSPAPAALDPLLDGTGVTLPPAIGDYTNLGWDFPTVWVYVTDGYPKLAWQP